MTGPSVLRLKAVVGGTTRRAFLLGGMAVGVCGGGRDAGAAQVEPQGRGFRTIAIDTSRLATLGEPQMADLVQRLLAPEVRQTFGDLITPGDRTAPTLVVRIRSISLSDYVGSRSYGGRNGTNNVDYLEGSGVVTVGGHVVSETPVLSALEAGYSGPWYLPGIDERRVSSIAQHFAYWLRREMGV